MTTNVRLIDGSLWEVDDDRIDSDNYNAVANEVIQSDWIKAVGPLFNEQRTRTLIRTSAVIAVVPS